MQPKKSKFLKSTHAVNTLSDFANWYVIKFFYIPIYYCLNQWAQKEQTQTIQSIFWKLLDHPQS